MESIISQVERIITYDVNPQKAATEVFDLLFVQTKDPAERYAGFQVFAKNVGRVPRTTVNFQLSEDPAYVENKTGRVDQCPNFHKLIGQLKSKESFDYAIRLLYLHLMKFDSIEVRYDRFMQVINSTFLVFEVELNQIQYMLAYHGEILKEMQSAMFLVVAMIINQFPSEHLVVAKVIKAYTEYVERRFSRDGRLSQIADSLVEVSRKLSSQEYFAQVSSVGVDNLYFDTTRGGKTNDKPN